MGKKIFTTLCSKVLIILILTCASLLVFHLPTPVLMLDLRSVLVAMGIAPDKDWRRLGIYLPLFGFIGYFKF